MDINKVILVGRICSDIELKMTQSGVSVLQFSIATNRRWKEGNGDKKEEATFHNLVCWGKPAETISTFFKKGDEIGIFGRINNRKTEKDGKIKVISQVVIDEFYFGAKKQNTNKQECTMPSIDNEIEEELNKIEDNIPF